MPNFRSVTILVSRLVLLLIFAAAGPAWSQSAALGGGLEQLVQMFESGSQKLPVALKPHLTSPTGEVLVEIRLLPGSNRDQVVTRLSQNGFRVTAVSLMDANLLEGYLPLSSARSASGTAGVKSIHSTLRPVSFVGSVPAEGAIVEKADLAQARGVDGTGTRLGALSDSYNTCGTACITTAAQDVATGDLPPGVVVLEDLTGQGTDEGRAMLQLAHKIAPGAALAFATADNGQVDFSNNILNLRRQFHADVIVDDIIYFREPMFSDGLVARTVDEVVNEGAVYFSSAGNNGLQAYEDDYRPISFDRLQGLLEEGRSNLDLAGFKAFLKANNLPTPVSVQSFRSGEDAVSVTQRFVSLSPRNVLDFQWDEPFNLGKVKTNFIVFVFDPTGHILDPNDPNFPGFYTLDDNTKTDQAVQLLALPNFNPTPVVGPGGLVSYTYQLLIANMNGGPAGHIKYVNVNANGESERQNAPSTWGHAAARHGQGVAAMDWAITNFPEDFSSPGPVTILFDNEGNRLAQPEIRQVPQITAADGASTTFFGNFFGTSAAAPDAGAVAALVIQSRGGPGSSSPSGVYRRLQNTATPISLSNDRTQSGTGAGPVAVSAHGDFTRFGEYFHVNVSGETDHTVKSVAINVTNTPTHMQFNPNPNRFHVGIAEGIDPANISASYSADVKTVTLSFAPGSLGRGNSFTFGLSVFAPAEGTTGEDADRMEGAVVTVTLDDNSTRTGTFHVAPKSAVNRFTGAGLVNADAATRRQDD
jgi:hypothetical protein